MKISSFIFIVIGLVQCTKAGKIFSANETAYYISHPMAKNWFQANRYCTIHNMFLLTIHTEQQYESVLNIIEQFQITDKHVHFWTSGTDLGQANREFYWITSGLTLSFTAWMDRSPRVDVPEKLCVLLHGDLPKYKWYDYDCNTAHFFICQSRLELPESLEKC